MKRLWISCLILLACVPLLRSQSAYRYLLDDADGNIFKQESGVLPVNKFSITVGDYSLGLLSGGISYNQFIKSETENLIEIDAQNVYNDLHDANLLSFQTELKTLGISYRLGKVGLGFQHSITAFNYFTYPKELFGTLFLGNAQYIGKTVPLGPELNSALMNSFGFGIGAEISRVKIAAKLNLLTGLAGAHTNRTKLDLYTDPEYYQLRLTTDYEAATSGLLNLDSLKSGKILATLGNYKLSDAFSSNFGLSVDLSVHARLSEKLSGGVSLKRLGYIDFNKNTNIYSSNKVISYDGLDLSKYITKDSVAIEGLLDSLQDLVKLDKKQGSFKMKLAPEVQLYAKYHLNEKLGLFGGVYFSSVPGKSIWSASGGVSYTPVSLITLGSNITYIDGSVLNIGLHGMLNIWKVSLQAGSDNILAAISPKNAKFATAYAGVKLNF